MRSGQRIHQALYPRQEGVHWQLDSGVRHKSIVLGRNQQRCLQAKAQRQRHRLGSSQSEIPREDYLCKLDAVFTPLHLLCESSSSLESVDLAEVDPSISDVVLDKRSISSSYPKCAHA